MAKKDTESPIEEPTAPEAAPEAEEAPVAVPEAPGARPDSTVAGVTKNDPYFVPSTKKK